ncbi:MAG: winged helix-turn-helix domain-containing protein, partial [Ruminococcus sp.]|nr:winged helix-turn-helix domain-containing protein [Ruminococcus sp.]
VVAEHIRRLRAKLAKFGEDSHIGTVWGMGYKWIK